MTPFRTTIQTSDTNGSKLQFDAKFHANNEEDAKKFAEQLVDLFKKTGQVPASQTLMIITQEWVPLAI